MIWWVGNLAGMKKHNLRLWVIGQLVALNIGTLVAVEHDFSVGFAVFFALCVLVDIRGQMG